MKAIKSPSLGHVSLVETPLPTIANRPGYVLVKTRYVGLNPADNLAVHHPLMHLPDATIGVEFSGVVVETDAACTRFKPGDRIAGYTYHGNATYPDGGTHAEYVLAKGDAMLKVDALGEHVTEAQAAGIGVAMCTAYVALYKHMRIPWPGEEGERETIFIYGGSSTSGMLAIQYAKLSGMRVVTTCSPNNFEFVKNLGADEAYDYHDGKKCADDIVKSNGRIRLVMDAIGGGQTLSMDSANICADVIAPGGIYTVGSPTRCPRDDVTSIFTQGMVALGEPFTFGGMTIPADQSAFEEGKRFLDMTEKFLEEGKLRFPPVKILEGIEQVLFGMEQLREGKVHALKQVVLISTEKNEDATA